MLVIFVVSLVMSLTGIITAHAKKNVEASSPHRITYDLGVSSGTAGDQSYTEAQLGLNYFLHDWLAWRNALFGRFGSGIESAYGVDTSARTYVNVELAEASGLTLFGGPGWRFVTQGKQAPFAEAGLVLNLGGLNLGGGVKSVFNEFIDRDAENDTQYFIILSGGGSL
ncbi:MAG: hypothetical protein NDI61_09085 [Bdellovibrionaceae bacterium]|nr:hypothetical protein [Pseudobdellovibrionaceae bacterium]